MHLIQKSSNGISLIPMETHLFARRKIFLEGEIGQDTACEFIKKIMVLNSDRDKPIDLLINSVGGEINAGLLIYDVIQACKTPIRMFCIGRAYSMAAVLFASGTHGRYMLPNSELMLHEPLLANRMGGSASSIHSISESLLETKRKLNRILMLHTGKTEEEINAATAYDHYYTSTESVDFGLADEIVEFDTIMEE